MLAPLKPFQETNIHASKPLTHTTIHLMHASLPALEAKHANVVAELSRATGKTQLLQATRTPPRADTAGGWYGVHTSKGNSAILESTACLGNVP